MGIHYNGEIDLIDYVKNKEVLNVESGYISRWDQPGLGIEIDEEKVREMAQIGHSWKNPIWRNADGSFAEW